ncbi:hypothetical protein OIV83_002853 [Microbotryomycetes sp. JL201]|nr:hypothetical protein OIV83_002853 [Microbotryomycetes sp. JL201]
MRRFNAAALLWTILFACTTAAADRVFFARSVAYCSSARAIEVDKFLFSYNADQQTITFDVDAGQVDSNLRASLQIELTAYGINAINTTINLCETLFGVLCPLPVYNFVASATLPLPSAVTQDIDIPGIGFIVPDLEAQTTVRLLRVEDNSEAVCLTVNLSNGKTVRLTGVSWALAGITIGAVALGLLRGLIALVKRDAIGLERGRQKERVIEIMAWMQFCASSGLLSLDYPRLYQSWTANFAWALMLEPRIGIIQDEIYDMRNRTGGNLTQLAGTIVGGTEAQTRTILSGLNVISPPASQFVKDVATNLLVNLADVRRKAVGIVKRQSGPMMDGAVEAAREVPVPDVQEQDVVNRVPTGISRYAVELNISPFNAFSTVFFNFLLLLCAFLAIALLVIGPMWLLARRRRRIGEKEFDEKQQQQIVTEPVTAHRLVTDVLRANALRLLLITWYPLLIFSFYQWRLGQSDAWAPIVLSVFTFLLTTAAVLVLLGTTLVHGGRRREQRARLFSDRLGPNAPFTNAFKSSRWWFVAPTVFATFARAAFISFAQGYGWVESIGLVAIEVLVLAAMCIFTPFSDKSSNGMQIIIQILRCIISAALIPFNASIGLNEIIRTAIGAVIAVVEAVVVVFLFILVLIDLVDCVLYIFRKPDYKPTRRTWYGRKIKTLSPKSSSDGIAEPEQQQSVVGGATRANDTVSNSSTLETNQQTTFATHPKTFSSAKRQDPV